MPLTKKSVSGVHVETKKMSKGNCMMGSCCHPICHLITKIMLLAILVLLIVFYCQYTKSEAMKVGGRDNYKLVKQIYRTQAFHDQQAQQIQGALQTFLGTTPTATQPTVQVAPTE